MKNLVNRNIEVIEAREQRRSVRAHESRSIRRQRRHGFAGLSTVDQAQVRWEAARAGMTPGAYLKVRSLALPVLESEVARG